MTFCAVVVYLYIPTSNHNLRENVQYFFVLYIFIFLHQTTTAQYGDESAVPLYIFIFLHQTTTKNGSNILNTGCISLYSYIKPQHLTLLVCSLSVVYLYIPTSNHNITACRSILQDVVYLYIPTSNHNRNQAHNVLCRLYIFIFLHQTTTYRL